MSIQHIDNDPTKGRLKGVVFSALVLALTSLLVWQLATSGMSEAAVDYTREQLAAEGKLAEYMRIQGFDEAEIAAELAAAAEEQPVTACTCGQAHSPEPAASS